MAVLIDAINVKKRTLFELDNTPLSCLDVEVNTPTARGGQTLVRLKMRNLLTNAVFEKTFKAGDKFKEPDLQEVPASYLYSDADGSHFLDQESFETLTLATEEVVGTALDYLVDGSMVEIAQIQRQPIGLEFPPLTSGSRWRKRSPACAAILQRPAPKWQARNGHSKFACPFIKQGEKVRVSTETGEFGGRA